MSSSFLDLRENRQALKVEHKQERFDGEIVQERMTEQTRSCDLVDTQMSLLCQEEGDERVGKVTQFNMETAIITRRVIIVKLPYSDMNNLPQQV